MALSLRCSKHQTRYYKLVQSKRSTVHIVNVSCGSRREPSKVSKTKPDDVILMSCGLSQFQLETSTLNRKPVPQSGGDEFERCECLSGREEV